MITYEDNGFIRRRALARFLVPELGDVWQKLVRREKRPRSLANVETLKRSGILIKLFLAKAYLIGCCFIHYPFHGFIVALAASPSLILAVSHSSPHLVPIRGGVVCLLARALAAFHPEQQSFISSPRDFLVASCWAQATPPFTSLFEEATKQAAE